MSAPAPTAPSGRATSRFAIGRFTLPRAPIEYRHLGRTLLLTVGVGLAAGVAACLFHLGVEWLNYLALGRLVHFRPPAPLGEAHLTPEVSGAFRPWLFPFIPAAGALLSGLLVHYFAPETGGGGGDAFIDAFHNHEGRMRGRVPLIKGLASILILGTGGSAGREGPIMQIGAGIGSSLARLLRLSDRERRLLLVAGTAAGMAAIFRTPLGAAIFAIEVLYRDDFEAEAIVPAIIASVTSYSVYITVYGESHLFATSAHYPFHPLVLFLYLSMAVVVSLAARTFVAILHGTRDHFWKRLPLPAWLKPALGGLVAGTIGLGLPEVAGIGYGWLQQAILWTGHFAVGWTTVLVLLGIAVAKMFATSATISSGGSGGDFGPSLVIGGLVGAACGQTFHLLFPHLVTQPGAFALVGMAVFYGGVAHTPLASSIMVCELTGSYDLLVPLIFTEGLGFILLRNTALYHAQVPNRAASPAHSGDLAIDVLATLTVGHAINPKAGPIVTVNAALPLAEFMHHVAETDRSVYPVVDSTGRLAGVVSLAAVRALLYEDMSGAPLVVGDALQAAATLPRSLALSEALDRLLSSGHEELPVVSAEPPFTVEAMLGFGDVVRAYNRELARRRLADDNAPPMAAPPAH